MDNSTDRYTITTYDNTGAPDFYITGVDTALANFYITSLESEGVEYYLELESVEEAL